MCLLIYFRKTIKEHLRYYTKSWKHWFERVFFLYLLFFRILPIPFKKVNEYYDFFFTGFCMLWIFITSQQRCLNDLCNGTVCLPGHASWIHFSQSLQKFWRRKVEIKCPTNFNAVPRHCVCSFLCHEFGVVVSTNLNISR